MDAVVAVWKRKTRCQHACTSAGVKMQRETVSTTEAFEG